MEKMISSTEIWIVPKRMTLRRMEKRWEGNGERAALVSIREEIQILRLLELLRLLRWHLSILPDRMPVCRSLRVTVSEERDASL